MRLVRHRSVARVTTSCPAYLVLESSFSLILLYARLHLAHRNFVRSAARCCNARKTSISSSVLITWWSSVRSSLNDMCHVQFKMHAISTTVGVDIETGAQRKKRRTDPEIAIMGNRRPLSTRCLSTPSNLASLTTLSLSLLRPFSGTAPQDRLLQRSRPAGRCTTYIYLVLALKYCGECMAPITLRTPAASAA